ncbi:light chain 3 [Neocallimastix californiae]|jgi:GABA(A) receptor-associated protein|uniref:Autophagy-related protein n=1 Tax=Neocallimastix californiae TaxID=1754190 RepID=A0A1Y2AM93_9FUNG|nr:light chain 3 [Neocallimastix californiae]|eukprot:ORY23604.1 light chain 3 [Neocallimastix californiae]
MSFRDTHTFEERKKEAMKIREKYVDRIPCIVEKAERSQIQDIDKNKFLVPSSLTIGQFMYVIRKRLKLQQEDAIFLFVNGVIPPVANIMSVVYEEHKDEDVILNFYLSDLII